VAITLAGENTIMMMVTRMGADGDDNGDRDEDKGTIKTRSQKKEENIKHNQVRHQQ
jgi:hypothetical protein